MTPEECYETLSAEVFKACRHLAPHGWIMDYVEYADDQPGDFVPTFADYLEFQLSTEEDDVNPPEYFEAIRGYLQEFVEYCGYCHTFGHLSTSCPDVPMLKVTVDLLVPASFQDPVEYVRGGLIVGADIHVNDIFLEEVNE